MAPAFNLYYFDAMGRAELIRLIFNYAGVAFNDVRIQGDWSALKASNFSPVFIFLTFILSLCTCSCDLRKYKRRHLKILALFCHVPYFTSLVR